MAQKSVSLSDLKAALSGASARWQAEQTSVSKLPPSEQLLRLGYVPGPGEASLEQRESAAKAAFATFAALQVEGVGYPASYDLRNVGGRNFVTPVKDQGSCGSCVAFGTCACVECTLRVLANNPGLAADLSEAHLFYCLARAQGRTCGGPTGGWWVPAALDAFKNTGVADEACYPYTPGDQNCTGLCADWAQRVTKVISWQALTSAADMKAWLSTKGALATCFTVYNDFFSYASGIYHHVSGGVAGGHCVCVVGYDDAAKCWICKNSWGSGWGESGFFRIAYGECGIDATMWGVEPLQHFFATLPLYRYWNCNIGDHFYTTNWNELGPGKNGWVLEGIQCYVYPKQVVGTVPLYRYWNPNIGDHFYTTNWSELGSGKYGWRYEGIQCYVRPQPSVRATEPSEVEDCGCGKAGGNPDDTVGAAASGEGIPSTFSMSSGDEPLLAPEGSFTTGASDVPSASFQTATERAGETFRTAGFEAGNGKIVVVVKIGKEG